MKIGTLLKEAREHKGKTQRQMAEKLGVTPGFVTKIETDEVLPSYERLLSIADFLDLNISVLWADVQEERTARLQKKLLARQEVLSHALRPTASEEKIAHTSQIKIVDNVSPHSNELRLACNELIIAMEQRSVSSNSQQSTISIIKALTQQAQPASE